MGLFDHHERTDLDDEYEGKVHILKVEALHKESERAYCVKDTKGEDIWLPKSRVPMVKKGKFFIFEVPDWLAKKYPNLEFEEE